MSQPVLGNEPIYAVKPVTVSVGRKHPDTSYCKFRREPLTLKKPAKGFQMRLKPPGKVTKAKKKDRKVAKKVDQKKKKPKNKPETQKDTAGDLKLASSPKSNQVKKLTKGGAEKANEPVRTKKGSPQKSTISPPKRKLQDVAKSPRSPKPAAPGRKQSPSRACKESPSTPGKTPILSKEKIGGTKILSAKKSKQVADKKSSTKSPKKATESGSKESTKAKSTFKTPKKPPTKKSPTRSVKKPAKEADRKSPNRKSTKSPSAPKKGSPKSNSKSSKVKQASPRVKSPLSLTPTTEMRATEAASKDAMLVKITPLKSEGAQRKRKNTAIAPKSSKKLKIKLTPKTGQSTGMPSPAKAKSNGYPLGGHSPSIVSSATPQSELPGAEGPDTISDSVRESALLFKWLISPVNSSNFFDNLWEKKPLLVRRHKAGYYQGLFSTHEFNNILRENDVQFGRHIDITTYTEGKRETHNPEGRAHPPVVWDYFNSGCSVRLLNPQTYSTKIWKLLDTLKEHFGSFCGANVYLTPAGTQGFAPHYDDIEAFILQLEGKKQWRLYSPRNDREVLPRLSSENFTDEDLGVPILDTVLEEGDILYFPRGYIHQASPPTDTHSLHLTVSTCQKNTYGDLMTKLIQEALQTAMEEDLDFRLSLPRDYLDYMGVINSDMVDERRADFRARIRELFKKMATFAPLDGAVDQMGKDLVHSSLPPVLTDEERSCMIYSTKVRFEDGGFVSDSGELNEETEIQLIRKGVLRLVTEEEEIRVYHCMENTRVYHEKQAQYFVIPPQSAPGVEFLLRQYPRYVQVQDLPLEGELEGKEVELASLLYEKALIRTKVPLNSETDISR